MSYLLSRLKNSEKSNCYRCIANTKIRYGVCVCVCAEIQTSISQSYILAELAMNYHKLIFIWLKSIPLVRTYHSHALSKREKQRGNNRMHSTFIHVENQLNHSCLFRWCRFLFHLLLDYMIYMKTRVFVCVRMLSVRSLTSKQKSW